MMKNLALRVLVTLQGIESKVTSTFKDEEGQTLAEYGLIMAVIAVAVIVAAAVAFKGAIVDSFQGATDCLNGTTTGCS
jgi:Flp pilus assembly pilin Flp